MDSVNNYESLRYKLCAGKGGRKNGKNRLKILFINRIGYFYNSCTTPLLKLDIVTKEEK